MVTTTIPLPKTRRQRQKKERVLSSNDGNVEIGDREKYLGDVIVQCEKGYPQDRIKPLLHWSEAARNYSSKIKSVYSQRMSIYTFWTDFLRCRPTELLQESLKDVSYSKARKMCYTWKKKSQDEKGAQGMINYVKQQIQ